MLPTRAQRELDARRGGSGLVQRLQAIPATLLAIPIAVVLVAGLVGATSADEDPATGAAVSAGALGASGPGALGSSTTAVTGAVPGAPGDTIPGATPGTTGDPGAGAAPGAPGPAVGAAVPGAPVGPAPVTGAGPLVVPAGGCDGAALSATDQGVSDTTIKVGFLIPNLNELRAGGFNVGLAGDFTKILPAWAKELNDNGGVACRKIEFVTDTFDVLDVDDMLRACKKMVQDEKVFAVLAAGGYDSVAQLCIAKDGKTPFINPDAQPAGWYADAQPYLWTTFMTKDRMHRNHIRYLAEAGRFEGKTVGVIYHGIPNVAPSVEQAMLPELKAAGVTPKVVIKLSSDSEQALSQINGAVLEMNRAGVDYVLFPMNLIFKTQFLQVAEGQQYFPSYTDSDHYFGCFDFTTSTYPSKPFDRTECVTTGPQGQTREQLLNFKKPFQDYANAVYLRANPQGYEGDQDAKDTQQALHIGTGSSVLLWAEAANRVGPQLTRPAWGEQMGRTGRFDKTITAEFWTFGPQKWDGPDRLAVTRWHAEAGDGFPERAFRLERPYFNAYV